MKGDAYEYQALVIGKPWDFRSDLHLGNGYPRCLARRDVQTNCLCLAFSSRHWATHVADVVRLSHLCPLLCLDLHKGLRRRQGWCRTGDTLRRRSEERRVGKECPSL